MKVTNFSEFTPQKFEGHGFHIPYFSSRYSLRSFLSLLSEANIPANSSQLNIFEEFAFWVSSDFVFSGLNVIVAIINIFIFSNAKLQFFLETTKKIIEKIGLSKNVSEKAGGVHKMQSTTIPLQKTKKPDSESL